MSHTLQWIIRFLHVFVGITVANAAVSEGKSCVGVSVGPCPVFRCVLLLWRRNASLAGGFAGRLVVWWLLCLCDLICPLLVQANCAYVPPFSPLMSLLGPCHSATTANPEEKKPFRILVRRLLPMRCFSDADALLHWNSAAEEGAWVGLKPDLQGGTRFNLLRVQFWTPVQRKSI